MTQAIENITNNDRLLPKQAAEYLGVQVGTLAGWRSTKKEVIPYIKVGHKVMYRKTYLDNW